MNNLNNNSSYHEILNAMEIALKEEDIQSLKEILISPSLSKARGNYDTYAESNEFMGVSEHILVGASSRGLIELVQFIFTNEKVDKSLAYKSLDYCLYTASAKGNLKVVKYLLESPETSSHINIDYFRGVPLISSCENGHLNVVRYLLDSPNLKKNADINYLYEEDNFIDLLENLNSNNPKKGVREVVEYLIFEKEFEKDERINDFINQYNNDVWLKMFESQELMQELDSKNENLNKRTKI